MIFESHAHYDDPAFDEDREELLAGMEENGVGRIINVCAEAADISRTIALAERYPFIYGAVGVHPDDADSLNEKVFEEIYRLCFHEKVVAVGEIGLDYHWDKGNHLRQKKWFCSQMEVAREMKLPFIIHSREAAEDTLRLMKELRAGEMSGGVIHCFSYGKEMAREYLSMGLYLGIGGVLTFPNARRLKEVVAYAPLEQLLLETDSPYLAPTPHRGKRNSSLNLPYVAEAIAQIKGVSYEQVVQATEENARRLFTKVK